MTKRDIVLWGLLLGAIVGIILAFFHQKHTDKVIDSKVLLPDVEEKLIIDPTHHTLIIIDRAGTKAVNLPNRPSSVEVLKNGKIRLNVPQYGFEHIPFVGIGYSSQLNDYIGMDFWYYKKLDIGTAFGFDRDLKIKTLGFPVILSYTVYHNLRLSVGYDFIGADKEVHGLVSVRI